MWRMQALFSLWLSVMACACSGAAPAPQRFIHVNPDRPTELVDPAGRPFEVVGINRFNIYFADQNVEDLTPAQYLDRARSVGINTVRIFINEGPAFEPEPGQYNQRDIALIDALFDAAEARGMYLIFCIFDHFAFATRWDEQVYARFGKGRADWFQGAGEMLATQKQRVRYLVGRYKDRRGLLAWEPMNEVNALLGFFSSFYAPAIVAWFEVMAATIREIDPAHLITQSLYGDSFIPALYRSDALDVVQFHTYIEELDPDRIPKIIEDSVAQVRQYGKPVWLGEFCSQKDNPQREAFIGNGLRAARRLGVPAFAWTFKSDHCGDLDESLQRAYRSAYQP